MWLSSLFTRNRPIPERPNRNKEPDVEIEMLKLMADDSSRRLLGNLQEVQSASRIYSRRLNLMANTLALKGAYHAKGGI
jgi:hypothetical protein